MNVLNNVVIPSVVFIVLEAVYLFLNKNFLGKILGKSESMYDSTSSMKTVGFIVHLFVELFALVYFLILGFSTVMNAFIFGVVLQGYTSSINYATVKDWSVKHSIVCTLWKGILFALTVYISGML